MERTTARPDVLVVAAFQFALITGLLSLGASLDFTVAEAIQPSPLKPYLIGSRPHIPAELVGEWIARRGTGTSYDNPDTGSYGAPNATTDSYKIFADGRYEHATLIQSSVYTCTTTIFGRETGPINVQGSMLTISTQSGTVEYKDTCRPNLNSKKPTASGQQQFQWRIERDKLGVKLCLKSPKGAATCYYRQ